MKWLCWSELRGRGRLALALVMLLAATTARAELVIEITQGVDNPTAIAIVPFAWNGAGNVPEDIAAVVDSDLTRSGQFAPVNRNDMLGLPTTEKEVFYRDWRAIQSEYLLIGRVSVTDQMRIEYDLFDVLRQTKVYSGVELGPVNEARMLGHRVSDKIYQSRCFRHPFTLHRSYPGARWKRLLPPDTCRLGRRQAYCSTGVPRARIGAHLVTRWPRDSLCFL